MVRGALTGPVWNAIGPSVGALTGRPPPGNVNVMTTTTSRTDQILNACTDGIRLDDETLWALPLGDETQAEMANLLNELIAAGQLNIVHFVEPGPTPGALHAVAYLHTTDRTTGAPA